MPKLVASNRQGHVVWLMDAPEDFSLNQEFYSIASRRKHTLKLIPDHEILVAQNEADVRAAIMSLGRPVTGFVALDHKEQP